MSDECLMKGKLGSLYFGEYQAGMRKFTLAGKSIFRSIVEEMPSVLGITTTSFP